MPEKEEPGQDIPQNRLEVVASACRRNALDHLRAAETLAEKGFYGFATAHLVLAEEELGKGLGYRLVIEGLAKIHGENRSRRFVVFPGQLDLEFQLYSPHHDKTTLKAGLTEILGLVSSIAIAMGLELPMTSGGIANYPSAALPPTPEVADENLRRFKMGLEEWRREQDVSTKQADRLKQRGLYVDDDGTTLSTPAKVERGTYQSRHDNVAEELRWYGPFLEETMEDVLFRRFMIPFIFSALTSPDSGKKV